jgi:hypothetical protein
MCSSKKNHSKSNIHLGHHASFGWPHFLVKKYEKFIVELVVFQIEKHNIASNRIESKIQNLANFSKEDNVPI